jgi:integrase
MTFGQWLDHWLEVAVKPPAKRLRTYEGYKSSVKCHIKPELGKIRLQQLEAIHLEAYYRKKSKKLSQTTLEHHHAIISRSLKSALQKKYVEKNVAPLVENRPKAPDVRTDTIEHCWDENEVRRFLNTAMTFGPQPAAFYALALDTGARKGELCGLKWANLDLDTGTMQVVGALVKAGKDPQFGPPKNGQVRTVTLAPETVQLLKQHRESQDKLKENNRQHYNDHGLVFAKEWNQMTTGSHSLGDTLQMNNIGQREFAEIIKASGVRPIKFHGMRHTCATLLLKRGIPVHVVSQRLGHKGVDITMNIYAHVLPSMQEEAAAQIASILYREEAENRPVN